MSSSVGLGEQDQEGEETRCLNSELWHACAGPLVCLPTVGTRVVYFPQGHSEQVAASTNKEIEGHIPNYSNLPPQLMCQLHNVTMHADVDTDEVYAQMTLQPLIPQEQDTYVPIEMGTASKQPTNYFCKTLTASDTSTHGGFSVKIKVGTTGTVSSLMSRELESGKQSIGPPRPPLERNFRIPLFRCPVAILQKEPNRGEAQPTILAAAAAALLTCRSPSPEEPRIDL